MSSHPTLSAKSEEMRIRLDAIRLKAACYGFPTSMFFPPLSRGMNASVMRHLCGDALRLCATCEVRDDCLQFARDFEQLGIWGGHYFGARQEGKIRINEEEA